MTATIHHLPTAPVRALPDKSLRADCEALIRRLVKTDIPYGDLVRLADLLDPMIETVESDRD